jgi:hypothetical protein
VDDTVATAVGLLFVAGIVAFFCYLVGAAACALAGTWVGPLRKIGIGFLGFLGLAGTCTLLEEFGLRSQDWMFWAGPPLLGCGAVLLARGVRRLMRHAAH